MILSFYFASLGCILYLPLKSHTQITKILWCGFHLKYTNTGECETGPKISYACNFYQMIFEITSLARKLDTPFHDMSLHKAKGAIYVKTFAFVSLG